MKNKKGLIILSSVVGICALGLIIAPLTDWSVDNGSTSGNIGKTSRFSRKAEASALSNMEELIMNDPSYKNGIVASYMVMGTRAQQFEALVNMSNDAAGDIPEFSKVLQEMNDVAPMISNVCASLTQAGSDLSAAIANEPRPDLAQNVINASLAYTTLQKQNTLAAQFIDTADKYLRSSEGTDALKLVRDQWVDYQQMTAALDGDEKAAKKLTDKGYLLSSEQTVAALRGFTPSDQLGIVAAASLSNALAVKDNLSNAVQVKGMDALILCSQIPSNAINSVVASNVNLQSQDAANVFNSYVSEALSSVFDGAVFNALNLDNTLARGERRILDARESTVLSRGPFINPYSEMGANNLISSFQSEVMSAVSNQVMNQNTQSLNTLSSVCSELGNAINATAKGNKIELNFF